MYVDVQLFLNVQEGTCGSSFLTFLNELEQEGVIALHHGDVPARLKGVFAAQPFWSKPKKNSANQPVLCSSIPIVTFSKISFK